MPERQGRASESHAEVPFAQMPLGENLGQEIQNNMLLGPCSAWRCRNADPFRNDIDFIRLRSESEHQRRALSRVQICWALQAVPDSGGLLFLNVICVVFARHSCYKTIGPRTEKSVSDAKRAALRRLRVICKQADPFLPGIALSRMHTHPSTDPLHVDGPYDLLKSV